VLHDREHRSALLWVDHFDVPATPADQVHFLLWIVARLAEIPHPSVRYRTSRHPSIALPVVAFGSAALAGGRQIPLGSPIRNTHGSQELNQRVEAIVAGSLGRFGNRLTRVEVFLSDENGAKTQGDDNKCVLEARPANMQPVTVTDVAATLDFAV